MSNFPDDLERQIKQINIDPSVIFKFLPWVLGVAVIALAVVTSLVQIDPEENGVVQRFGKINRIVLPGLNYKLPFGIEVATKVNVKNQRKLEFGFRSEASPTGYGRNLRSNYDEESIMLTGDRAITDVEWVTQYRVSDPRDYLFKVREVDQTLRDMNESIMREIVGDRSIDEVLTLGRSEIGMLVEEKLQALCNEYEMGIQIDQVILQDVNPPEKVRPAFNEVNQAQQEKEKLINLAKQEYYSVIPKAEGEAAQVLEKARGYAVERVNQAKGDSARFNVVFTEYQKAPEVTRLRIYLETMESVLHQVENKVIIDKNVSGVLPLLNLDQKGE
jgi:modulator of FtsH protease HflK